MINSIQNAPGEVDTGEVLAGGGEMGVLMRSVDWSSTPLGPVSTWSQALRTTVGLLLRNRFPLLLWWGSRFIQLYNDAYRPIPGAKHPQAMGQPASECWAEIWHVIGPMIEAPFSGRDATWSDDLFLLVNRKGFVEETHFKVAYSPVPDPTVRPTGIGGVLATVAETTAQVCGERQLQTLRELGVRAAEAKTPEQACETACATFRENPSDVPFALFYLLEPNGRTVRLAASCNFDVLDGDANPRTIDLESADDEVTWPALGVIESNASELVTDLKKRFSCLPTGRWSEPPRSAIVLPLRAPDQPRAYGILVAGISPHRALDESYRTFFELAASQVVTAVRNALAYEDARLRAEKLAEIDRAKTAFFSSVSHEFRTPLTLMLGPLEDALAHPSKSLSSADLETVHRSSLRLLKLVNALLDFARIEARRYQACFEPRDLAMATAEIASMFRSAIERAGLRFVVHSDPLPLPVYVDVEMWEKIVLNLLSNALKFTFEGEIEVALRAVGERVECSVRDTGVGIPKEELPRLFERFHRIEGARARTHEGSGIGLALVQELVRLHGGEISAESEPGKGTRFTIVLQFGTEHLVAERISARTDYASTATRASAFVAEALRWLPDDIDSPRSAVPPSIPRELRQARILVVDDNADMREYLSRLLRRHWSVEAVADGAAALATLRHQAFDLVLSDVMMPELDGFGLLRAIKSDAVLRMIPVILVSARAGEESRLDALQAGADEYCVKPFSSRELLAHVAKHLQLARARLAAEHEKEKLHRLFADLPFAVAMFEGPNHLLVLSNRENQAFIGTPDSRFDLPLLGAVSELVGQPLERTLDRVYATGVSIAIPELHVRAIGGDGVAADRWYTAVYQPTRDAEGNVNGVIAFGLDTTETAMARSMLEEAKDEADCAHRAKDEFLAMLAPELRNPLSPILTALQLMQLRAPGVAVYERDIIERQVRHLTRLVDDLLVAVRM